MPGRNRSVNRYTDGRSEGEGSKSVEIDAWHKMSKVQAEGIERRTLTSEKITEEIHGDSTFFSCKKKGINEGA